MQLDERIRVDPVPADGVAAVDDRDLGVRLGDQRVGEGEAGRAGADDEVVRAEAHWPKATGGGLAAGNVATV